MDVTASERRVIETAIRRAKALVARDSPAIERLLAPDFLYTNASGVVLTCEQYLQAYVRTRDVVWHSQEMEGVRVRVFGNVAVLTARLHDRATFNNELMDAHFRTTQVYLRGDDEEWKYVAGHTSSANVANVTAAGSVPD